MDIFQRSIQRHTLIDTSELETQNENSPNNRRANAKPMDPIAMPTEERFDDGSYEALIDRLAQQKVFAKYEILPRMNTQESMVVTDPDILAQFKYRLTGKKKQQLKAIYPIISGHILEHYLRYGKPPFRNCGVKRDVKWCRF